MKRKMIAKNIKVCFHGYTVTLADESDRQTTPEGITLWVKQGGANSIKPMAELPDSVSLGKFMHERPYIQDVEWEEA